MHVLGRSEDSAGGGLPALTAPAISQEARGVKLARRHPPPWSPGRKQTQPRRSVSRGLGAPALLAVIKTVHTLAWFSIESCMVYLLYAGFRRQSDSRAAIAGAVVAGESLIFAANGFRCPLTRLATRFGAERGGVTDIFLPKWIAHNLPAIHAPLLALAVVLHLRNIRSERACLANPPDAAGPWLVPSARRGGS